MITNNIYMKRIIEKIYNTECTSNHSSTYYLKKWSNFYGNTYDTHTCQNKLYKDIATSITGNTYTNTNYDIKYLHDIAENVYDGSLTGNTMNYYLRIISENISVVQYDTDLEWLVRPTNIVYGDNFNATGLLTTDGVPIAGETVKLLIGDTVVGSVVTDNSGNASFSGDSHVHTGTHSFKLVYSGGNRYKSSDTGNATVTIDKETSYLNLPSNSTLYTDGSMSVSGSLLDNDPNPIIGKEVTLTDGTNTFTATSDDNGEFSFDLSSLSVGTHSLTATFVDGDYTGNTVNISVVVADPYGIVSADKPILSYADGDSAIVSATFYSGVDYSGETVTFYYNGNVLGTGTVEEGVAVCTTPYESQGIGDIVLSAEVDGTLLIQTYSIIDALKYDDATSDNTSKYDTTYSTGQTFNYDSSNSAYKLQRTSNGMGSVIVKDLTVPNNVEISYLLKIGNSTSLNTQPALSLFNENGSGVGIRSGYNYDTKYFILSDVEYNNFGTTISRDDYNSLSQNTWYRVVLSHNNGTVTAKLYDTSDNLLKSVTGSTSKFSNNSNKVGIICSYANSVTLYFKELKVKPL